MHLDEMSAVKRLLPSPTLQLGRNSNSWSLLFALDASNLRIYGMPRLKRFAIAESVGLIGAHYTGSSAFLGDQVLAAKKHPVILLTFWQIEFMSSVDFALLIVEFKRCRTVKRTSKVQVVDEVVNLDKS
jgi:hypothetical protein